MELNKLYNENNLETMARMENNFIDLTVTSPPYDDMKTYNGYSFQFEQMARELYRVTKEGGIVVWIVGDAVVNGSETLTSFKQALYFKEIGFNVHDTMIYQKTGMSKASVNRYHQIFEYMFVLVKGKPKTFNPLKDRKNKYVGTLGRNAVGGKCTRGEFGMRFNVWEYSNGKNHTARWDDVAFKHPAPFPEPLVADHINSWSNEGDLIYDCFMGSGTTAKMAKQLNRKWIGSEISKEYCDFTEQRLISLF